VARNLAIAKEGGKHLLMPEILAPCLEIFITGLSAIQGYRAFNGSKLLSLSRRARLTVIPPYNTRMPVLR
jgi:hypothetical protein